jgi:hypothetical protein
MLNRAFFKLRQPAQIFQSFKIAGQESLPLEHFAIIGTLLISLLQKVLHVSPLESTDFIG